MHHHGVDAAAGALTRLTCARGCSLALFAMAALVGVLTAEPSFAARPFVTDDADVIKPGACEVELVHSEQRARMAQAERSTSAQLGCGVGASTELALAAQRTTRGSEHWPVLMVGGKTGLRPVSDGALGVAVAYSLVGEKLPGSAFKQTRAAASLVATESRGRVLAHGNLGFAHDRVLHANTTVWGFAVEKLGDRFDFGGEVFGENSRSAWLGAGARHAVLPDRLSVDASYSVRSNSARARRVTLGMTLAF